MASTLIRILLSLEGAFYGSFHDGVKTQDMKALMLESLLHMIEFSYERGDFSLHWLLPTV